MEVKIISGSKDGRRMEVCIVEPMELPSGRTVRASRTRHLERQSGEWRDKDGIIYEPFKQ